MPTDRGHDTRYSDSSFYDVVCKNCGGTDAISDDRLKYACAGSERGGQIEQAKRLVIAAEKELRRRKNLLDQIVRQKD